MIDNFIPDIYQKSIYNINYKRLKKNGIKCFVFDLDNTIASIKMREPSKKSKDLFLELKDLGFKVIIVSNATKHRVEPFKEGLGVDAACRSCKPCKGKFLKILKLYHLDISEVAIIGDQLLTDVYGGNKVGIKTILVNPISTNDFKITKLNRMIENYIFKKLQGNQLLVKGKYYND